MIFPPNFLIKTNNLINNVSIILQLIVIILKQCTLRTHALHLPTDMGMQWDFMMIPQMGKSMI